MKTTNTWKIKLSVNVKGRICRAVHLTAWPQNIWSNKQVLPFREQI